MRSITLKAALAAMIITVPLSVALAAGGGGHGNGGHGNGSHGEGSHGDGGNGGHSVWFYGDSFYLHPTLLDARLFESSYERQPQ